MNDARERREIQADWYTARIAAAVVQVNSRRRVTAEDFMSRSHAAYLAQARLRAEQAEEETVASPDDIARALRRAGIPVIDQRAKT